MRYNWLSLLTILSAVSLADLAMPSAPLWSDIRVKHTWNTVPANWESLGPPPTNTTIDLYVALKPYREKALIDALYEVSDPGNQRHASSTLIRSRLYSPMLRLRFRYGVHLSKEQVAELVAPHQDTLELVHSWLEYHGVPSSSISRSHGGGWLTIAGVPVSQADDLLCASYQLYRHTGTNGTILRTVSYGLPAALHAHVQTVAPTTYFGSPRRPLQTSRKRSTENEEGAAVMVNATSGELVRVLSKRDGIVTPEFLRSLYNTNGYKPSAMDNNMLGILGFDNEYPSQEDLTLFMTDFREDAVAATYTVERVNHGDHDPSLLGDEADLDIQYSGAMAYPTKQIFYSTGGPMNWSGPDHGPASGDAYLDWLQYILNKTNIPQTISISYNNPEPDFPLDYVTSLCNLFALLGVRGVSVLVSSGDKGVGPEECHDRSGNAMFIPMFPASCTCGDLSLFCRVTST
jgi:tripeptidyl-peptidase-1